MLIEYQVALKTLQFTKLVQLSTCFNNIVALILFLSIVPESVYTT